MSFLKKPWKCSVTNFYSETLRFNITYRLPQTSRKQVHKIEVSVMLLKRRKTVNNNNLERLQVQKYCLSWTLSYVQYSKN
jgi:hypothetical protein